MSEQDIQDLTIGDIVKELKTQIVNSQVAHNKPTREHMEGIALDQAETALNQLILREKLELAENYLSTENDPTQCLHCELLDDITELNNQLEEK